MLVVSIYYQTISTIDKYLIVIHVYYLRISNPCNNWWNIEYNIAWKSVLPEWHTIYMCVCVCVCVFVCLSVCLSIYISAILEQYWNKREKHAFYNSWTNVTYACMEAPPWSNGSMLDHSSLPPVFESRRGHS